MADSTLAVERRGDVVWCALDRPPLNLFEPGLIAALRATFEALARDAAIRAAVVTGRGRAFTAGDGAGGVARPPAPPAPRPGSPSLPPPHPPRPPPLSLPAPPPRAPPP